MGVPVKLKKDGFVHMGEEFEKGDIFNAPHEAFASFLCDQELMAVRVNEEDCGPETVGSTRRTVKKGAYNTKVMTPDTDSGKPVTTKNKKKAKSTVKD